MNKHEIIIPEGIEYISQYKEYSIPRGEHCIVDKGVTGCGYTEFALTNNDNIVLCSPRKLLLENKSEKHDREGHANILYLNNDSEITYEGRILSHLKFCIENKMPVKFMVTYDSMWRVSSVLYTEGLLDEFIFVVDEFQSIFLDSYFKSEVEIDFVGQLQGCKNVIYLSATPMLDKYLSKIDEFKDLTFYRLDWSKTGFVETVYIGRKNTNALSSECVAIVNKYLSGEFPITTDPKNRVIKSKEAVFYFNSVEEILRVVRKCKLTPENTIIICSKTDKNERKLKKEGFTFGRVPLEGEPNPMFIFCTSAVYMGVDFHSNCASSFVFADPNIECLALDISLDLPQIIGRQRDKTNPFKNQISMFYKIKRTGETKLTQEEFDKIQETRRQNTRKLLEGFNRLTEEQRDVYLRKLYDSIEYSNYKGDFISISKRSGKPVYNSLIDISNERAWDVAQKDYQDRLSVTRSLSDLKDTEVGKYTDREEVIVSKFLSENFFNLSDFRDKMKSYCDFRDYFSFEPRIIEAIEHRITDSRIHQYYKFYGTEGCSSRDYQRSKLEAGLLDASKEDILSEFIYNHYDEGDRVTKSEIKDYLKNLYVKCNVSKTAKATDLEEYFKLTRTQIITPEGPKNGFKLGRRLK